MVWHIFLQFLLHGVCCRCFGQEENVGTLFDDLQFSSFSPLLSLTLESTSLLLCRLPVCTAGRYQGPPGEFYRAVSFAQGRLPRIFSSFITPLQNPDFVGSSNVGSWKIFLFLLLSIGVTKFWLLGSSGGDWEGGRALGQGWEGGWWIPCQPHLALPCFFLLPTCNAGRILMQVRE